MDRQLQKITFLLTTLAVLSLNSLATGGEHMVMWKHALERDVTIEKTKLVLFVSNDSGGVFWFPRSDVGVGVKGFALAYFRNGALCELRRSRLSVQEVVLFRTRVDRGKTVKIEFPLGMLFDDLEVIENVPHVVFYSLELNLYKDGDPFSQEKPFETIFLDGVVQSSISPSE